MLVGQLVHKNYVTVFPDEPIQDAAKKMRDNHVVMALVLENEKFRGIITEQEIANAIEHPGDIEKLNADGDRCCYFSDVMVEILAEK